jgi:hypothetical protein
MSRRLRSFKRRRSIRVVLSFVLATVTVLCAANLSAGGKDARGSRPAAGKPAPCPASASPQNSATSSGCPPCGPLYCKNPAAAD